MSSCTTVSRSQGDVDIGGTSVSKWKDGKRTVYLLSFDDNLQTQLDTVIPILNERKVTATFYVVTGSPLWVTNAQRWEDAAQSPYVMLANHTYFHEGVQNAGELKTELTDANEVLYGIYRNRIQPYLLAFAQPGGVPWDVTAQQQAEALKSHNLVERAPFRGSPMNYTTQEELLASVDQATASGEMGHDDMHGVDGDYLVTPLVWLIALLDKLEAEKEYIWVPDAVSYAQYLAERQSAEVTVLRASANAIRLSLTSKVDPQLYNYPLTLTTKVPIGWISARVTQGSTSTDATVKDGKVMFDAVPGAGEISLIPK